MSRPVAEDARESASDNDNPILRRRSCARTRQIGRIIESSPKYGQRAGRDVIVMVTWHGSRVAAMKTVRSVYAGRILNTVPHSDLYTERMRPASS